MTFAQVDTIAGRVWTGSEALKLDLWTNGGLDDAIVKAASLAKINKITVQTIRI
jgi:ClpP class serine protease